MIQTTVRAVDSAAGAGVVITNVVAVAEEVAVPVPAVSLAA